MNKKSLGLDATKFEFVACKQRSRILACASAQTDHAYQWNAK